MLLSSLFIILLNVVFIYTTVNDSKKTQQNDSEREVRGERIVGGRYAKEGEVPYQVGLLRSDLLRVICGGSILKTGCRKNSVIVTAAHCIVAAQQNNFTILVRYNTRNWMTGPIMKVKRTIVNKNYNATNLDNDIALLILESRIKEDINAKPIELTEEKDPKPFSTITNSGWGLTSTGGNRSLYLKVGEEIVVERRMCRNLWAIAPPPDYPSDITYNQICYKDATNSQCFGDSGGPVTQDGKLIGVVSFGGAVCLDPNAPNGCTRAYNYRSWINRNINFN